MSDDGENREMDEKLIGRNDCAIIFRGNGVVQVVVSLRSNDEAKLSRDALSDTLDTLGIGLEDLEPYEGVEDQVVGDLEIESDEEDGEVEYDNSEGLPKKKGVLLN